MGLVLWSCFEDALAEGVDIDFLAAVSAVSQRGMKTTYEDSLVMMKSTLVEECLKFDRCYRLRFLIECYV